MVVKRIMTELQIEPNCRIWFASRAIAERVTFARQIADSAATVGELACFLKTAIDANCIRGNDE